MSETSMQFLQYLRAKGYSANTTIWQEKLFRRYEAWLSAKALEEAGRKDICAFLNTLKGVWYRRKSLQVLKKFYGYLARSDKILINPTEKIENVAQPESLPKDIPGEEEMRRLVAHPKPELPSLIFRMFYSTGMRFSELVNLKVKDLDYEGMTVHIREGKGKKDRVVPVDGKTLDLAKGYIRRLGLKADEKLCTRTDGRGLGRRYLEHIFDLYGGKCGVNHLRPHVLRHAFAVHLLRRGASLVAVSRMLGHKDVATTQIYTRLCPLDLKEGYEKSHPLAKKAV